MISIFKVNPTQDRVLVSYDITRDIDPFDLTAAIYDTLDKLVRRYDAISNPKTEVTMDDVESVVSRIMNISSAAFNVKTRKREMLAPRQIAHYMSRVYTKCSLSEIGLKFGGKDHATVLHSVKIVANTWMDDSRYGYGPIVKAIIEEMEEMAKVAAANKRNQLAEEAI